MSLKSRRAIFAFATLFLFTVAFHLKAHADTYQFYTFGVLSNEPGFVEALDSRGDVVINASFLSGGSPPASSECLTSTTCYLVFQPIPPYGFESYTATIPPADYTGMIARVYSGNVSVTLFNNGYEAYLDANTHILYGGPVGDLTSFGTVEGISDYLALNNNGDIAWTDGNYELDHLMYDVTAHATPEPASLLLLATGLATLTTFTHRRRGWSWSPKSTK
ncbi:MAG TPA: PEP-CTERM sorting domain-containing protein [Edaphobacter sp.]|nr:PEP-CTERM sorting domain-containing protein [Edaphobacter sp.]